jgi:hypothetical protein
MKVSELKSILEREDDNLDVMILIDLPYATVGSRPMVGIESVYGGFDWEAGRLMFKPTESLTPADRDFAKQMKEMQERAGWADYENRNLKAEIRKLKKQLKVEE